MAQYDFTEKGPKIIWLPFWLFVSSRPRQWLKNLALFGPLIFEGAFFDPQKLYLIILGFIILSIVTSAIYIINDVIYIEKDKAHPYKKRRAIAAGKIHPYLALFASIVFLAIGLFIASSVSTFFGIAADAYTLLQITYSLFLRSIILLDVMAIAGGFLLRIYAGAVLINAHVTVWFILTVVSLAFFFSICKNPS